MPEMVVNKEEWPQSKSLPSCSKASKAFKSLQKPSKATVQFEFRGTAMQGCVTKSEHKVPQLLRSRSDLITRAKEEELHGSVANSTASK